MFLTRPIHFEVYQFIAYIIIVLLSPSGKSIEDPPSKANSSVNQISELTFYETLSPILNAWIKVGLKCKMNIEKAVATMRELSDMVFMRLLAEALDWHDDRTVGS